MPRRVRYAPRPRAFPPNGRDDDRHGHCRERPRPHRNYSIEALSLGSCGTPVPIRTLVCENGLAMASLGSAPFTVGPRCSSLDLVRLWCGPSACGIGGPAAQTGVSVPTQRCCLADLMSRLMAIRVRALRSSSWVRLSALARALTSSGTESAAWLSVSSSVSIWTLNSASCALVRRPYARSRTASGSSVGGCSCSQNQRCIKQRR